MGGKVSTKMAAPAGRVIQVVRPHAPLIRFPNREGVARPNVQEALKVLSVDIPLQSTPTAPDVAPAAAAPPPPPPPRPQVPVTRLPGAPDTLASLHLLPQRYRRRPMAVEEMEYIQRGGPE